MSDWDARSRAVAQLRRLRRDGWLLRFWTRAQSVQLRSELEAELVAAYSAGYDSAHKWQMDARVRDAQECRQKNGRHL